MYDGWLMLTVDLPIISVKEISNRLLLNTERKYIENPWRQNEWCLAEEQTQQAYSSGTFTRTEVKISLRGISVQLKRLWIKCIIDNAYSKRVKQNVNKRNVWQIHCNGMNVAVSLPAFKNIARFPRSRNPGQDDLTNAAKVRLSNKSSCLPVTHLIHTARV